MFEFRVFLLQSALLFIHSKQENNWIRVQKHTYHHSELELKYYDTGNGWTTHVSISAWKNSVHATIGGVKMLLSPRVWKSLISIEKAQPRLMCAIFNGNTSTAIVSFYSPTNSIDKTDITTFYDGLSSRARHIPDNVLIIGWDTDAQIDKDENKFCLHNQPNRNVDFSIRFFSWKQSFMPQH